jgi:ATP-dependent RNA helicase RhlE
MGHTVAEIHSDRSLNQRKEALEGFKLGKYRILVATDIAARGIDVTGIELVLNYDLPEDAENYVHRIGRTARAGASGIAISLVSSDEMPFLRDIERLIRLQVPMAGSEKNWDPTKDNAEAAREARRGGNRGGGGGNRRDDNRPARHADGGQPNRGKRSGGGGKGRPQGEKHQGHGNGGNRNGGSNRQPDNRPSKGSSGGIAEVGFMGRPRRTGGMSQGSASR